MLLPSPLTRGTLIQRYKRFLADVRLDDGTVVTAHCANPGSMMGLNAPGLTVWLSRSDDPKRKLAYSWQLLELGGATVGINTAHPNAIVAEAIAEGRVLALAGYDTLRREVKYGRNSRVDIFLTSPGRPDAYVEVKNVHLMRRDGLAEFPDCVTTRGAKHLEELGDMVEAGHRAVMVFLVQRDDCDRLSLARDLDPAYGKAYDRAAGRGVETLVLGCRLSTTQIAVARELPFLG